MSLARLPLFRLAATIRVPLETASLILLVLLVAPAGPGARSASLGAAATASASFLAAVVFALAVRGDRWSTSNGRRRAAIRGALIGLLALNEELLWRRLALCELLRCGVVAAWAASSVAFALGHRSRPGLHLATGSALGGIYLLTGALGACICAHWGYNLLVDRAVRARRRA